METRNQEDMQELLKEFRESKYFGSQSAFYKICAAEADCTSRRSRRVQEGDELVRCRSGRRQRGPQAHRRGIDQPQRMERPLALRGEIEQLEANFNEAITCYKRARSSAAAWVRSPRRGGSCSCSTR